MYPSRGGRIVFCLALAFGGARAHAQQAIAEASSNVLNGSSGCGGSSVSQRGTATDRLTCSGTAQVVPGLTTSETFYGSAVTVAGTAFHASANISGYYQAGPGQSYGRTLNGYAGGHFYDYLFVTPLATTVLSPAQLQSDYLLLPASVDGGVSGHSTAYGSWTGSGYLDVGLGSSARGQWVDYASSSSSPTQYASGPLRVPLADFANAGGRLDFFANFSASLTMFVQATGGAATSDTELFDLLADFSNTATIGIARVYDAAGNDISNEFRLTTASGRDFNAEATTVPEPTALTAIALGLTGVGVVARKRRTRA